MRRLIMVLCVIYHTCVLVMLSSCGGRVNYKVVPYSQAIESGLVPSVPNGMARLWFFHIQGTGCSVRICISGQPDIPFVSGDDHVSMYADCLPGHCEILIVSNYHTLFRPPDSSTINLTLKAGDAKYVSIIPAREVSSESGQLMLGVTTVRLRPVDAVKLLIAA